jgi:hypothetical protein
VFRRFREQEKEVLDLEAKALEAKKKYSPQAARYLDLSAERAELAGRLDASRGAGASRIGRGEARDYARRLRLVNTSLESMRANWKPGLESLDELDSVDGNAALKAVRDDLAAARMARAAYDKSAEAFSRSGSSFQAADPASLRSTLVQKIFDSNGQGDYEDAIVRLFSSQTHTPSEAIDLIVEGSGGALTRQDVIYAVLRNSTAGGVQVRSSGPAGRESSSRLGEDYGSDALDVLNAEREAGTAASGMKSFSPSDDYIRAEAGRIDEMLGAKATPTPDQSAAPQAPSVRIGEYTAAERVRQFIRDFLRPTDRPAVDPQPRVFDAPSPADPIRRELNSIGDISSANSDQLGAIKSKLAALRSVARSSDPSISSAVMQDIDNSLAAVDARANELRLPPAVVARANKELTAGEAPLPPSERPDPTPTATRYSFDSPSGMPAGIAGVHLDMAGAQELRRLLDGKMFDVADQKNASVRPIGKPELTVEEIEPRQVETSVKHPQLDVYVKGTKPVRRARVTVRQKHSGGVDAVRTVEGDLARPGEGGGEGMATVAFDQDGVAKFYRPGDFAASTADAKRASRMARAGEDEAMALTAGSVDITRPTPGPGRAAAEREYQAGQAGSRTSRRSGGRQPQRPDGENSGYGAIREDDAAGLRQVEDAADDVESTARGGRADAAQRVRKARATARSAQKDAEAARQEAQSARDELARARSESAPADPTGKPLNFGKIARRTGAAIGVGLPALIATRIAMMDSSEMAYGASPSIDDPNMSPDGDETDTIKRSEDVLRRLGRARQNSYLTTQRPLPY